MWKIAKGSPASGSVLYMAGDGSFYSESEFARYGKKPKLFMTEDSATKEILQRGLRLHDRKQFVTWRDHYPTPY